MSAAASGGLFGSGPDTGWLKYVGASNTDLVFGMVSEELGLIVAVVMVLCILTFSLFTVKAAAASRSTFYTIAACAASTMLVFQTALNVLGSVDLLPLTGVTFPFVSCGGSSLLACWTMLAFIKAGDNRQNAGLAIRLPGRHDDPVRPRGDPMMEFDPSVFDDGGPASGSTIAVPLPDGPARREHRGSSGLALDLARLDLLGEDCGIDVPLPESPRSASSIDIPLDGNRKRSSIDIPVGGGARRPRPRPRRLPGPDLLTDRRTPRREDRDDSPFVDDWRDRK